MIPALLLKKLYTTGSLRNTADGIRFAVKNRLIDADLTQVGHIAIDGQPVSPDQVQLELEDGRTLEPAQVTEAHPVPFPLRATVILKVRGPALAHTRHEIEISFEARPFGRLELKVEDTISEGEKHLRRIPRADGDDDSPEIVAERRALLEEASGIKLQHIIHHSFDPHIAKGNCENFVGVAQVPIGLAGPLVVNGEHAKGEFLIPLATSEGTLVASHNRGMKVLNQCGGVHVTVMADAMQHAPVFVFESARASRAFVDWVQANLPHLREEAEATSRVAKLQYIDPYVASKFAYLRFNFTTGDAAGQNMVGRATFAACNWILDNYEGIVNFYLESNFATDKKASQINIMRTRGKRVTAEATIKRDVLVNTLRVDPDKLAYHYGVANVGAFLSGANNNGLQSANGITALFIATGQDVAMSPSLRRACSTPRNPIRRSVHLAHHPVTDCGHAWRRHGPGDAARVPGDPRLQWKG